MLGSNLCSNFIIIIMAYGAETWALTTQAKNKLPAVQTKMERSMLKITYRSRKTNTRVTKRQRSQTKWIWAGHVSRIRDNRWTLCITTWKPYERKRPRGRPARGWRDELDDYWMGTIWQRIAQVRQMWKQHAEAFIKPRDTMAAQWWWRMNNVTFYSTGIRHVVALMALVDYFVHQTHKTSCENNNINANKTTFEKH